MSVATSHDPSRQQRPSMACAADFEGRIVLDDVLHDTAVSVYLTEHELILGKGGGQRGKVNIFLHPFSPSMILDQDPQRMRDGFFFEVKGTKVGSITHGPLGHPGDGEFDFRDMTSYRADITYLFDRIRIEIRGATTTGTSCLDGHSLLPAMEFSVHFDIPKHRIVEFFKLTDRVRDNLLKAFDLAFAER